MAFAPYCTRQSSGLSGRVGDLEALLPREALRDLSLDFLLLCELFLVGSRSREAPGDLGEFSRTVLLDSRVGERTRERERDVEFSREFVRDSREPKR